MSDLDIFDLRILAALQSDGRLTQADLAGPVRLSPSQISRRIQRLEQEGVIQRQVAIVDAAKLHLGVTAYVSVVMRSHSESETKAFRERMRELPEVLECCKITGEADYLLKITTRDLDSYNRLLTAHLLKAKEVASVRSNLMLERVKQTTALPLPWDTVEGPP